LLGMHFPLLHEKLGLQSLSFLRYMQKVTFLKRSLKSPFDFQKKVTYRHCDDPVIQAPFLQIMFSLLHSESLSHVSLETSHFPLTQIEPFGQPLASTQPPQVGRRHLAHDPLMQMCSFVMLT